MNFTVDLNQFRLRVRRSRSATPAFAPLPESFFKDPKAFGEKPVGNGPYKLEPLGPRQGDRAGEEPRLQGQRAVAKNDGVTFKVYTEDCGRLRATSRPATST